MLVPDGGQVFVPPHLRVLHVTSEVYFVNESLRENVFFATGNDGFIPEETWERGLRICRRLESPPGSGTAGGSAQCTEGS